MKLKKSALWIIAVVLVGGIAAAACFWLITQKEDPYDKIIKGLKPGQALMQLSMGMMQKEKSWNTAR